MAWTTEVVAVMTAVGAATGAVGAFFGKRWEARRAEKKDAAEIVIAQEDHRLKEIKELYELVGSLRVSWEAALTRIAVNEQEIRDCKARDEAKALVIVTMQADRAREVRELNDRYAALEARYASVEGKYEEMQRQHLDVVLKDRGFAKLVEAEEEGEASSTTVTHTVTTHTEGT